MSIDHLLEEFGTADPGATLAISDLALEEERLAAFEKGYGAGWEDAVKSSSEDKSHVSADLSANLQDIAFTCQEAQTAILKDLEPLLRGMVEQVLPRLAHETLGARVTETLMSCAAASDGSRMRIVCAPSDQAAIESIIDAAPDLNVSIEVEPSLGAGQVHLKCAASETAIDLKSVLAEIDRAVTEFFATGAPAESDETPHELKETA